MAAKTGIPSFSSSRVSEKGRSASSSVRINLFLLGELHSRTVHQPHQRHPQKLSHICGAENVFRLSHDPGSGNNLVVKSYYYSPLSVYSPQSVYDPGCSLFIVRGIENGMKWTPCPAIHQILESLPDGQLSPLVNLLRGKAGRLNFVQRFGELFLDFLDLGYIVFALFDLGLAKRFAYLGHLLEVRSHPISSVYFHKGVNVQSINNNNLPQRFQERECRIGGKARSENSLP